MAKTFLIILFIFSGLKSIYCQTGNTYLGAYYFDGWKKVAGNTHLTPQLKTNYSDRQPVWGWVTSTQSIMDKQIVAASDAGLSFFSFCWYYRNTSPIDSSNRALYFFNHSPEKEKLKFCLLIANHQGYEYGPNEWSILEAEWIKQFKQKNYLTVDGKPLIIFFFIINIG